MKKDNEYLVVVAGGDMEMICGETKMTSRNSAHEDIGQENGISIAKSVS